MDPRRSAAATIPIDEWTRAVRGKWHDRASACSSMGHRPRPERPILPMAIPRLRLVEQATPRLHEPGVRVEHVLLPPRPTFPPHLLAQATPSLSAYPAPPPPEPVYIELSPGPRRLGRFAVGLLVLTFTAFG